MEKRVEKKRESLEEPIECSEFVGRITSVIDFPRVGKGETKPGLFVAKSELSGHNLHLICPYFCPVQENDCMYALVVEVDDEEITKQYKKSKIYRIIRPPFVSQPVDKNTILQIFISQLKQAHVGAIKAGKLYDIFAERCGYEISVIDYISELALKWVQTQDPDLLVYYTDVVPPYHMGKLLFWWHKFRSLRRLYLMGLNNKEIEACHLLSSEIYNACITNPHKLFPLSMDKCEEILLRQSKEATSTNRICGKIIRKVYANLVEKAWTSTPVKKLRSLYEDFNNYEEQLVKEFDLVKYLNSYYLRYVYEIETYVVNKILNMLQKNSINIIDEPYYKSPSLTDEQKRAIAGALEENFSIITGGPGTGKTTIIGEICNNLELQNIKYIVASFTGKAVARIREVIRKKEASTLHRLIARSQTIPPFEHLIIDEASMVTTELFYTFLKHFPGKYKITLVGDVNQLQPVSWGSLFSELIESEQIPTYRLTYNHRVLKNSHFSSIIKNANLIIADKDEEDYIEFTENDDFHMTDGSIQRVYDILRDLYDSGISIDQMTIITPFNDDIKNLNSTVQQIFNETEKSVSDEDHTMWCLKDKVMMTRNNYYSNIMNGEMGRVIDASKDGLIVQFDSGTHVFSLKKEKEEDEPRALSYGNKPYSKFPNNYKKNTYAKKKNENDDGEVDILTGETKNNEKELLISMLVHAYALTTHKAQGSEWDYVIVYLPKNKRGSSFINKNLLYTAITRAKKTVYVVGDLVTFRSGSYRDAPLRLDNLSKRLLSDVNIAKTICKTISEDSLDTEESDGKEIESKIAESKDLSFDEV